MSDKQSTLEQPISNNNKISRRTFINPKFWFPAAVATYAGLKGLETAFYESVSMSIKNPNSNDDIIDQLLKISESASNSENPNFRSMSQIINEGNLRFERATGKKPFFKRIDGYKDVESYDQIVQKFSSPSILIKNPENLMTDIIQNLPDKASDVYAQSSYVMHSFQEIYSNGSGFLERFKKRHPEQIHQSGLFSDTEKTLSTMENEGKNEIVELSVIIDNETTRLGSPISSALVYEYFLEKNDGDIALSLVDIKTALKFLARNDLKTGLHTVDKSKTEWYVKNIKDEFQGPSYDSVPEGETGINLIGKVYHSWDLVSLLQFVPVEIIRLGGVQKQLSTFSEQGLGKTRADLQTLNDLRDIENLLLSYPEP